MSDGLRRLKVSPKVSDALVLGRASELLHHAEHVAGLKVRVALGHARVGVPQRDRDVIEGDGGVRPQPRGRRVAQVVEVEVRDLRRREGR